MPKAKSQLQIINTLKSILMENQSIGTQDALCQALREKGFIVTQSSLSRLLRKIPVVKTTNADGQFVYSLPKSSMEAPASAQETIASLIQEINHNETVIVIQTNPGCAQLIASLLDQHRPGELIGTIAGDDTLVIIPHSIHAIEQTEKAVKNFLFS